MRYLFEIFLRSDTHAYEKIKTISKRKTCCFSVCPTFEKRNVFNIYFYHVRTICGNLALNFQIMICFFSSRPSAIRLDRSLFSFLSIFFLRFLFWVAATRVDDDPSIRVSMNIVSLLFVYICLPVKPRPHILAYIQF